MVRFRAKTTVYTPLLVAVALGFVSPKTFNGKTIKKFEIC